MFKIHLMVLLSVLSLVTLKAQTSRDVEVKQSKSLELKPKKSTKKVTKRKSKSNYVTTQEIVEYSRRKIQKVLKEKAKMNKKLSKPQYSDRSYFGHKRPPKRRSLSKRKFCKVCGIVH